MRVIVIRHHAGDSAGLIAEAFRARGAELSTHLFPGEGRLPALDEADHVVVLGAFQSVYDDGSDGEWVRQEMAWLREADDVGVPVFGICFGAQALCVALGGSVEPAPAPEVGWRWVGTSDPALVPTGPWWQFHVDRCLPPPRAVIVARNEVGVQAFTIGRNIAVQFHPEMDAERLRMWLDAGGWGKADLADLDPDDLLTRTRAEEPAARARAAALVDAALRGGWDRGGDTGRAGAAGRDTHRGVGSLGGEIAVRTHPAPAMPSAWPAGHSQVVGLRTGLRFSSRRLPFEEWLSVGRQLSVAATSSAWCLGDWLIYGQQMYGGRYREAVERTGLEHQTLRNYAWVARRFELDRRWASLSFAHHAEVASLPKAEQEYWLRQANLSRWPVSRLRSNVRTSLRERQSGKAGIAPSEPDQAGQNTADEVLLRVRLSPEQAEDCERAARQRGLAVSDWAAEALHDAARTSPADTVSNVNGALTGLIKPPEHH